MNEKLTISALQLYQLFPEQESARAYLEARRWPNGVECPVCANKERIGERTDGFYRCHACKEDFTVRTVTIFERSKVPLHKWLYAMYLLLTKGISSLQLSNEIGITQKSAWFVLHRIREACGDDLTKLQGVIEIYKTHIGGKEANKHESKKLKPAALDAMTDRILAYKPQAQFAAQKKRAKKTKKTQREESS